MAEARIAFQNGTAPASTNGTWNTVNSDIGDNVTLFADLSNFQDAASLGWGLFVTNDGSDTGSSNGISSPGTGDASWVDEAVVFGQARYSNFTLSANYTGLDPAKTYTLEFTGATSGGTAGTDVLEVTVDTVSKTLSTNNNTSEVIRFSGVSSNASGEIDITSTSSAGAGRYAAWRIVEDGASGPSITSSPATAFPGQSRTATGTGFGATQGTGGVTIGGIAQTITEWSDTSVSFTTVLGTNSYGTGKTLELTTDAATTDTSTIELVADTAGGFGVVTMSSPNTTDDSSVAFNATPAVETGDQFEWEDFNALGNLAIGTDGFVESVDTEGTFRGRFWDATDSTWGTVENFTATVPDEVGPATTSVNVPNAATYAIGDTLSFTVNWDENANVTGTPRLPLTFGSGTRYADYASGTGTTALVFSYTVQEGDEDTDGIAVNTIELNGGTIQDSNSNAAALTLNGVENTAGIIVDGIRPVISVNNTTTSDTTPAVSGSAGDATSLTLVVTGIGTYNPTPSGGSWSQTLPESPLGEYSMTLDGTDAAGNTAVQASGTLNIIEQDAWPFGLGIKPAIPVTWDWGKRHPTTGMRVRLFKRGGQ